MKSIIPIIIAAVFFIACKDAATKHPMPATSNDSAAAMPAKKDFSKLHFASEKDLSCGMPLTAGLEDTAHYKGKIYGFCSSECKADFVKNAEVLIK